MQQAKVWWITGASSGIGAALADCLSQAGASVILSGRNRARLDQVAHRVKTPALVLPFEATDYSALPDITAKAWAWAATQGANLHGLINNAGVSQRSLAVETAFEVYQQIVAIDLLAPIALTQAVLPRMVAAGGGHIVAISSVAGILDAPLRSAYSAAKHGLIGYHDSIRAETAHQGIQVLVVAPGSVATDVSRNALGANARARGVSDPAIDSGMPADVAAACIVEAIDTGKRELILAEGAEAEAARLRRANPDLLFDMMAKLVASGYVEALGANAKS